MGSINERFPRFNFLKMWNNKHMRHRLGILACLIGLGIAVLCPSICVAQNLSQGSKHDCCTTQTPHKATQDTCSNSCNLHKDTIIPDQVNFPHVDLFYVAITFASPSIPSFESYASSFVTVIDRPPGHLIFLNTIRLQC